MEAIICKVILALCVAGVIFLLRCLWALGMDSPGKGPISIIPNLRRKVYYRKIAKVVEPPTTRRDRGKTLRCKTAIIIAVLLPFLPLAGARSQDSPSSQSSPSSDAELHDLHASVKELQSRVERLENKKTADNVESGRKQLQFGKVSNPAMQSDKSLRTSAGGQNAASVQSDRSSSAQIRELRGLVQQLQSRVEQLENPKTVLNTASRAQLSQCNHQFRH